MLQSIAIVLQASCTALSDEAGISFGSTYDLFGIIYWIDTMNNS